MLNQEPTRVIAVSSGKGGVGKTNVSVNLAYSLARRGLLTVLLDADLGMANVDVLLGLHPERDLEDVLNGQCALDDILIQAGENLMVIPAGSGVARLASLSNAEHDGLVQAFSTLPFTPGALIIDTAAGISESVCHFCCAAHEVIVVVCNEPASLTDGYALMKVLSRRGCERFQLLVNRVSAADEADRIHRRLSDAGRRFLGVNVALMGAIPDDVFVRRAVQRREAVVDAFPGCPASGAFRQLARRVVTWPRRDAGGRPEFFAERRLADVSTGGVTTSTL